MATSAVPCGLSGSRRRLRTGVATAVLAVLVVATPVTVALVVHRVLSARAVTGAGGLDALGRSDVVVLLVAVAALCAWFPGAAVAVGELRGRDRAVRASRLAPRSIQRVVAANVEASVFGVGSLAGWTRTRVDGSLDELRRPVRVGAARLDDAPRPEPVSAPEAAGTVRLPAAPARPRRGGATVTHVVERGETWWALAERFLGEGRRFTELKELNLGRAQPDGSVVERDSVLRAGWTIEVPKVAVPS